MDEQGRQHTHLSDGREASSSQIDAIRRSARDTRAPWDPPYRPEADRPSGRRLHMGTATSDPSYLPLTPQEQARERALAREQARQERMSTAPGAEAHRGLKHSNRYLQTPKAGHTIFTSRRERRARRMKLAIALLAFLVLAAVLAYLLSLR
ncbi:MAG: hypothetical protein SOU51_02480 [Collinsella sp.]|nr:hypothetical protein [Collinsella sp.]